MLDDRREPRRRRRARCGRSRRDRRARWSAATARRPARCATTWRSVSARTSGSAPKSTSVTPSAGSAASAQLERVAGARAADPARAHARSASGKAPRTRFATAPVHDADARAAPACAPCRARARAAAGRRADAGLWAAPSACACLRRRPGSRSAGAEPWDRNYRIFQSTVRRAQASASAQRRPATMIVCENARPEPLSAQAAPRRKVMRMPLKSLAAFVAGTMLAMLRLQRVRRRRLQESRRTRHDVLRRQQRHGRRRADRFRRNGRTHRPSCSPTRRSRIPLSTRTSSSRSPTASRQVPRQEGRVLPGAVERRGNRGDALGPAARRRLLDRPDGVRGQSRRRGSVRGQGHREGIPGLQPDRHRQGELAVPEALRPQGQEGRAHVAVVEFRASRADGAVSRRGARRPTRTTRSSSPASTTSR